MPNRLHVQWVGAADGELRITLGRAEIVNHTQSFNEPRNRCGAELNTVRTIAAQLISAADTLPDTG
jgi:hypothetical protein